MRNNKTQYASSMLEYQRLRHKCPSHRKYHLSTAGRDGIIYIYDKQHNTMQYIRVENNIQRRVLCNVIEMVLAYCYSCTMSGGVEWLYVIRTANNNALHC